MAIAHPQALLRPSEKERQMHTAVRALVPPALASEQLPRACQLLRVVQGVPPRAVADDAAVGAAWLRERAFRDARNLAPLTQKAPLDRIAREAAAFLAAATAAPPQVAVANKSGAGCSGCGRDRSCSSKRTSHGSGRARNAAVWWASSLDASSERHAGRAAASAAEQRAVVRALPFVTGPLVAIMRFTPARIQQTIAS